MKTGKTASAFPFPRRLGNRPGAVVAFPLGGLGTGTISLGERGQLKDWELFSRADKGRRPRHSLTAVWVREAGRPPQARVVEGCFQPPYEGSRGLGRENLPGLPRFRRTRFTGMYPFAQVRFLQPRFPLDISLEAFNPMIPLNADDSGLPIAVLRYRLRNATRRTVAFALAYSLTNLRGREPCRDNTAVGEGGLQGVQLAYRDDQTGHDIGGTICIGSDGPRAHALPNWNNTASRNESLAFWDEFSRAGRLPEARPEYTAATASVASRGTLQPGVSCTVNIYIVWHFPRRTLGWCGWSKDAADTTDVGNFYARPYADAWDAMRRIVPRLPALERKTRAFSDALQRSTLPPSVREALTANMSTLRTQTLFRTADGAWHGFEGCNDQGGSCYGDCNHVFNYDAATGMLFPELQRSLLDTVLFVNTDENGVNSFRTILPAGRPRLNKAAADGTMGSIVRLYRHWRHTGDTDWLRRCWPVVRKIFEFAWSPRSWDADRDGVMEGLQHNTYDVEFYGPNPLCAIWYLAALKAAAEMGRALGDREWAERCTGLFASGSRWVDRHLFNGSYYRQLVRPIPEEQVLAVCETRTGEKDRAHPYHQVEGGCLVDQLAGQCYAHLAGLGHLLDPARVRKALRSVLRYNHRADLYEHASAERVYALNDEPALTICSYPRGGRPEMPMIYTHEIMTGFEHQAAVHLMYEGLVEEGVRVMADVRRRYDGFRRNPWNEAECGHHYVRALACWGALPALSGFRHSALEQTLAFDPKIGRDDFRCFFITADGWGVYRQRLRPGSAVFSIELLHGTLVLQQWRLPRFKGAKYPAGVRRNGRLLAGLRYATPGTLTGTIELQEGERITVWFKTHQTPRRSARQ